jgi:hypothetical protein
MENRGGFFLQTEALGPQTPGMKRELLRQPQALSNAPVPPDHLCNWEEWEVGPEGVEPKGQGWKEERGHPLQTPPTTGLAGCGVTWDPAQREMH